MFSTKKVVIQIYQVIKCNFLFQIQSLELEVSRPTSLKSTKLSETIWPWQNTGFNGKGNLVMNSRRLFSLLWLPHEMEGIMFSCSSSSFLIWVEIFTDLDEVPWVHYESVSVCPSVCRQIKRTLTQKVTYSFSRFIHIRIKHDCGENSYEEEI